VEVGRPTYCADMTGRYSARNCCDGEGPCEVVKKKSKAVPLHAMEAHGGRGGIASTHI
jgi:hypothetical protein